MLIHHTVDTCSEFQVAFALNSENADSEMTHSFLQGDKPTNMEPTNNKNQVYRGKR